MGRIDTPMEPDQAELNAHRLRAVQQGITQVSINQAPTSTFAKHGADQ